jgi:RND family efflux transporter MFP subunit
MLNKHGEIMKTKRVLITLASSALMIVVGIVAAKTLISTAPQAPKQPRPISGTIIEVVHLSPSTQSVDIPVIGTVEASQKTTLSFKVSGKITHIHPHLIPGSFVKKGDVLAQIDPTDYQASLDEIRAKLLSAKADLQIEMGQQESAKKELELTQETPTGLSRSLILREPQLQKAKASMMQLEASYTSALNNLKETRIHVPYDGVIASKSVDIGSYVSAQSTIAELVATDSFWMKVSLPVEHLAFLETHDPKALAKTPITLLDAQNRPLPFKARLFKILPELDGVTKQAKLILSIDDPFGLKTSTLAKHTILLGDTLQASIQGKRFENVYLLEPSLLRANNTVWVMDEHNKLAVKKVDVLYKNAQKVLVRSGITPQDKIISTYLSAPVEGMNLVELQTLRSAKKGE